MEKIETQQLEELKKQLETEINSLDSVFQQIKDQILIDFTALGLRIQIVDLQNRPMFNAGKADLQPYAREILEAIAPALNDVPNKIGLSGHTDSTPYFTETGYSNWELSADRANASRRALLHGGLADNKILRVVGLASAAHLDRADPFNPINRRISIIVMNKRTEENVLRDGDKLQVGLDTEATQAAAAAAPAAPAGKK